jgi:hypothetical protein
MGGLVIQGYLMGGTKIFWNVVHGLYHRWGPS